MTRPCRWLGVPRRRRLDRVVMCRRELILGLAGAIAGISAGLARAAGQSRRLAVLSPISYAVVRSTILPALASRGFVEGRNLVVDLRIGTTEELPELARELVRAKPDAILAVSDWAVAAARRATRSIPIVASPMGADPVAVGLARSWARPGGNVTGVTLMAPELEAKRLGLLHEAVPAARRIAMLSMHREVTEPGEAPLRKTAARLGLRLDEFYLTRLDELAASFAAMHSAGAEAVVVVPVPEFAEQLRSILSLAAQAGLPSVCGNRASAAQGCVIGYGPDQAELGRAAAAIVARIFDGASPGDLPIVGPTRYQLEINLKTAKALGLTVPRSLLAQADEVIE